MMIARCKFANVQDVSVYVRSGVISMLVDWA